VPVKTGLSFGAFMSSVGANKYFVDTATDVARAPKTAVLADDKLFEFVPEK